MSLAPNRIGLRHNVKAKTYAIRQIKALGPATASDGPPFTGFEIGAPQNEHSTFPFLFLWLVRHSKGDRGAHPPRRMPGTAFVGYCLNKSTLMMTACSLPLFSAQ